MSRSYVTKKEVFKLIAWFQSDERKALHIARFKQKQIDGVPNPLPITVTLREFTDEDWKHFRTEILKR